MDLLGDRSPIDKIVDRHLGSDIDRFQLKNRSIWPARVDRFFTTDDDFLAFNLLQIHAELLVVQIIDRFLRFGMNQLIPGGSLNTASRSDNAFTTDNPFSRGGFWFRRC